MCGLEFLFESVSHMFAHKNESMNAELCEKTFSHNIGLMMRGHSHHIYH